MSTHTYLVDGMTCDHCAAAVTREVGSIQGVSGVVVDVSARTVAVTSESDLDERTLADAVTEAGYAFAGRA